MVIPFSNTKLRVPTGFQTLLVGLSTEVLRSQPKNINAFAADYFEKLVKRREQGGQSHVVDNQASLQDRYYNNQSFQEEYPVNDPEVNHAATKIQAKFRGHKARQNVEKMKHDTKEVIDTDQLELGYGRESTGTPNEHQDQILSDRENKSSPMPSELLHHHHHHRQVENNEHAEEEELTEEEKQEQERAARSIQARFRGFKSRQNITPDQQPPHITPDEALHSSRQEHQQAQEWDNERTPTASSARFSDKTDHDRQDFDRDSTTHHHAEAGDTHDIDRPRLEREPTQLSEDFELHIQIPRDPGYHCEQVKHSQSEEDNDMDDLNLDKAATRIQASFRGYKARKELGPTGQSSNEHHQHPSASLDHDHYQHSDAHNSNTEGNKVPELEEEDAAAAVKIQAAYRGYRARKDLEK